MQPAVNAAGLTRTIPEAVKREVRQRSKFGCVMCRSGFFEYEHITPFAEVSQHDPAHICCLCASCHSRVTRGQLSKKTVRARYEQIRAADPVEVGPPVGPLDFHRDTVSLTLGGLFYPPAMSTLLRYYGDDVIRLEPPQDDGPGAISAIFTDDDGQPVLGLERNEWVGNPESWDIEVVGPRITVRKARGHIALALRLDPPTRVVVERMDMRIGPHHVLASERGYAIGSYTIDGPPFWFCDWLVITGAAPWAAALEFNTPEFLSARDDRLRRPGLARMESANRGMRFSAGGGAVIPNMGLAVAPGCTFESRGSAAGYQPIDLIREAVFHHDPGAVLAAIGGGIAPR